MLYEDSAALGGILGNLFYIYPIAVPGGKAFLAFVGLFAGIFAGCWAMALAEILNVFPIAIRRMKLTRCIPYIILGLALGKRNRRMAVFCESLVNCLRMKGKKERKKGDREDG